jgi:hypothetical protein|tara:strand:+ start:2560 stop:3012 length:453 start_codon:yes stop_codon:yes gene_type:complete
MKTIVRNEDNISLFYFDDDTEIVVGKETKIIKDGEEILTIADSEPEGVTIYTEVDAVPDWYGWKYFYDGSNWTVNEDFKGRTDIVLGIDNATTDITVRYPNALHSSGSIQINDEVITYTGIDGLNLTGVERGAESTTASEHAIETYLEQI